MSGTLERMDRPTTSELGDFLRTRRARLRPADPGLTRASARRRVPGLRREELARLAGVSVNYYTRLEQGRSRSASEKVLDALATALQLDDAEKQYLLAWPDRNHPNPNAVPDRSGSIPRRCGCWRPWTARTPLPSSSDVDWTCWHTTDWPVR